MERRKKWEKEGKEKKLLECKRTLPTHQMTHRQDASSRTGGKGHERKDARGNLLSSSDFLSSSCDSCRTSSAWNKLMLSDITGLSVALLLLEAIAAAVGSRESVSLAPEPLLRTDRLDRLRQ